MATLNNVPPPPLFQYSSDTTALFLLCVLLHVSEVVSTPEKPDCDWVEWGQVARMRDLSDCRKFYYCVRGRAPYQGSCPILPDSVVFYTLYFNPNTTHCDFYERAHPSCFGTGTGTGTGVVVPAETTTTTTLAPTTTTKPPRPPPLDDKPDFEIDCRVRQCGLFANTYGRCDTYVICVNGQKQIKKCNGGQLFDVKTKECQPINLATCWTEPNAGPHTRKRKQGDCPFHGKTPATPIEENGKGIVLQNPVVTSVGSWQPWQYCPKGKYATGIYAWRRMLMQGFNYEKKDHAGIVAVSFICQSPGGNETKEIIESLAPNLPMDGWPFYYMCKGAVVGFRLNSAKNPLPGTSDFIATDNVQGMCSCSGPVYKPYEQPGFAPQNGNRGDWTAEQNCRKGQAVCGMQTQMQEYKELLIGTYDNQGMSNMKILCCDVPSPFENCVPKEERQLVRICDNSESDESLRCDFEGEVGISMDYENQEKLIDFYSSIGYTLADTKKQMSEKIETGLKKRIEGGSRLEYSWDDVVPTIFNDPVITPRTMYVKPFKKLELYQITGGCSYFLVRTNRYLKVITDANSGQRQQIYFEV